MDNIKDHEKIEKQITKTSDSIRKKYRALETGKLDEDVMLERRFRRIIKPLKRIVEAPRSQQIKKEANAAKDISIKKKKHEDNNDNDNNTTNRDYIGRMLDG
ncbi:hypothetical protein P5V15_002779 [Pogonomyrmex californicus]